MGRSSDITTSEGLAAVESLEQAWGWLGAVWGDEGLGRGRLGVGGWGERGGGGGLGVVEEREREGGRGRRYLGSVGPLPLGCLRLQLLLLHSTAATPGCSEHPPAGSASLLWAASSPGLGSLATRPPHPFTFPRCFFTCFFLAASLSPSLWRWLTGLPPPFRTCSLPTTCRRLNDPSMRAGWSYGQDPTTRLHSGGEGGALSELQHARSGGPGDFSVRAGVAGLLHGERSGGVGGDASVRAGGGFEALQREGLGSASYGDGSSGGEGSTRGGGGSLRNGSAHGSAGGSGTGRRRVSFDPSTFPPGSALASAAAPTPSGSPDGEGLLTGSPDRRLHGGLERLSEGAEGLAAAEAVEAKLPATAATAPRGVPMERQVSDSVQSVELSMLSAALAQEDEAAARQQRPSGGLAPVRVRLCLLTCGGGAWYGAVCPKVPTWVELCCTHPDPALRAKPVLLMGTWEPLRAGATSSALC